VTQPSPDSSSRPFWLDLLRLLGMAFTVSLIGALVFRDVAQISNFLFFSSVVLLVIAVIPIVTEMSGTARAAGRAFTRKQDLAALLQAQEEANRRGARRTYLYGTAAILTFILSLVLEVLW